MITNRFPHQTFGFGETANRSEENWLICAHISLLQNTQNAQNCWMPCKIHNPRHHHLARLFAMPAFGEGADRTRIRISRFSSQQAAQKLPARANKLYRNVQKPASKCNGRDSQGLCVGEVVKRVMSPNVNR